MPFPAGWWAGPCGPRFTGNWLLPPSGWLSLRCQPAPGFIHQSDQGVQYASEEYEALLAEHGAQISMSLTGNPYDNALAESFMATLKKEEVYLQEYQNLGDDQRQIGHFIEDVYNRKRLHSSLGYRPPVKFPCRVGRQGVAGGGCLTHCFAGGVHSARRGKNKAPDDLDGHSGSSMRGSGAVSRPLLRSMAIPMRTR